MSGPIWVACEGSGRQLNEDDVCPQCKAWAAWTCSSPGAGYLVWEPHYRQDGYAMQLRGDFDQAGRPSTDLERPAEADEAIRSNAEDIIASILRHDLTAVPTDDLVEAAVALMRHRGGPDAH